MRKPIAEKEGNSHSGLGTVAMVALDLIDRVAQPRKTFGERDLQELAASMKEVGQQVDILLRPKPGGRYELVYGERRVRAARGLGWHEIRAIVRDMSDEEAWTEKWLENAYRLSVNPIDQALAIEEYREKTGLSWERIGEIIGMKTSTILARRRLLLIPLELQRSIRQGQLPATYGEYLGEIDRDLHPEAVKELMRSPRPSLDDFEATCKRLQREKSSPPVMPQGSQQSLLFDIGEPGPQISDSVVPMNTDPDPQAELLRPKAILPPLPRASSLGAALERYRRQLVESEDPAVRDVAWVVESIYQELRRHYLIRTGRKRKK
jgi:ParB/RepB/Spo0J family partition protein